MGKIMPKRDEAAYPYPKTMLVRESLRLLFWIGDGHLFVDLGCLYFGAFGMISSQHLFVDLPGLF